MENGGQVIDRAEPAVLPPALRAGLALVAVVAALVVVAVGGWYAGHGRPGAVDAWIQPAVDDAGAPCRRIALAIDFLGEPIGAAVLVGAAVVGCLLLRSPRAAVQFVGGAGVAVAATKLLKPLVGRTIHGDNLSYPSGHTAFLTAFALTAALLAAGRIGLGPRAGALLVLAAALAAGAAMGWAQVALGAHYPTDVLGGWCTALAVVPATGWLVDRWKAG
ncbi:phosphatase PAP2 family protein [Streptomyces sp. NPDC017979]|uniref:phosphatase PAP2 family protein n=1 Tax=Streptomyces sp. NPDC017979 TaxID=3365024 RepID=UPI0037AEF135